MHTGKAGQITPITRLMPLRPSKSALLCAALLLLARGGVRATVDEAHDYAMEAATPFVNQGFTVREDYWNGEVESGQQLAIRHQLFKGQRIRLLARHRESGLRTGSRGLRRQKPARSHGTQGRQALLFRAGESSENRHLHRGLQRQEQEGTRCHLGAGVWVSVKVKRSLFSGSRSQRITRVESRQELDTASVFMPITGSLNATHDPMNQERMNARPASQANARRNPQLRNPAVPAFAARARCRALARARRGLRRAGDVPRRLGEIRR